MQLRLTIVRAWVCSLSPLYALADVKASMQPKRLNQMFTDAFSPCVLLVWYHGHAAVCSHARAADVAHRGHQLITADPMRSTCVVHVVQGVVIPAPRC